MLSEVTIYLNLSKFLNLLKLAQLKLLEKTLLTLLLKLFDFVKPQPRLG